MEHEWWDTTDLGFTECLLDNRGRATVLVGPGI